MMQKVEDLDAEIMESPSDQVVDKVGFPVRRMIYLG